MKNDEIGRKNECSKGHQLSAVKAADFSRGWICDESECKWSPEEELDQDVIVWRCHQDFRLSVGPYSGTSIVNEAGETNSDPIRLNYIQF